MRLPFFVAASLGYCGVCPAAEPDIQILAGRFIRQPSLVHQGIGRVEFPITCQHRETQDFFNQAVALLHGGDVREADRSFHHASRIEAECAMAWWGRAVANAASPKLARYYIQEAGRLRDRVTERERRWIAALVEYLDEDRAEKTLRLNYVRALDRIATDYPEDTEAVAFLVRQFLDNRDSGSPIPFRAAVESLIEHVERACPEHPIICYRIRLWGPDQPQRAVASAERIRRVLFASPPALTLAGSLYSRLGQIDEAIACFEASASVACQRAQADRILIDQVEGAVENLQQLAVHLGRVGRVREAIMLAKRLIQVPVLDQTPEDLTSTGDARMGSHGLAENPQSPVSSTAIGQRVLLEVLLEFELWDEMLSPSTSRFLVARDDEIVALRIYTEGVAHFELGNAPGVTDRLRQMDLLADRLQRSEEGDRSGRDFKSTVAAYSDELRFCEQISQRRLSSMALMQATHIPLQRRAALMSHLGDAKLTEELARELVSKNPGRAAPLMMHSEALFQAGMADRAAERFSQLAACHGKLDQDLPAVQRLVKRYGPIATKPAPQPSEPSSSSPAAADADVSVASRLAKSRKAPEFVLPDRHGESTALSSFRGKPVLLVFYLGAGCPHCIEQLKSFTPLKDEYERAGITVIAISTDSVVGLQDTFKLAGAADAIPFLLLSDQAQKGFRDYGAYDPLGKRPLHGSFLVDPGGNIRWQNISYEPFMATRSLLKEAQRLLALGDTPDSELVRSGSRVDR